MILCGDALTELKKLDNGIVQTCITSPPYWGLRDYGVDGQLGLESTLKEYIVNLVETFRAVRRVLKDDGTLWLNMGDSYRQSGGFGHRVDDESTMIDKGGRYRQDNIRLDIKRDFTGLKPKDLCMIPARVALALQADGWYLRSDIIWAKPNPMPESVTDRPTSAHEHIFLLAKNQRYFYDADAIREEGVEPERNRQDQVGGANGELVRHSPGSVMGASSERNKRNVWTVATQPYPEAHFATFPPDLIEPCVLAGSADKVCEICGAPWERMTKNERSYDHVTSDPGKSKEGPYANQTGDGKGTHDIRHGVYANRTTLGFQPTCTCNNEGTGHSIVLDPFMGSGTTAMVALKHRREFIGIELNPEYVKLAEKRLREVEQVMF